MLDQCFELLGISFLLLLFLIINDKHILGIFGYTNEYYSFIFDKKVWVLSVKRTFIVFIIINILVLKIRVLPYYMD